MTNPIIRRHYYAIDIKTLSPVLVANGSSEHTDNDIFRDRNDHAVLPGSSLAGAFRAYCGQKKNEDGVFGFSLGTDGRMSSVFISDTIFDSSLVSVRNHVRLTEDRQPVTGAKFDSEVVDAGTKGRIVLEFVIRKGQVYDEGMVMQTILYGLSSGELRIGADKNRGFGKLEVCAVADCKFTKDDGVEWLKFLDAGGIQTMKGTAFTGGSKPDEMPERYLRISVPLKLTSGLSIRQYSAEPGKADYQQLINGEKNPVVPGSSWSGCIRSAMNQMLSDVGVPFKQRKDWLKEWFGNVPISPVSDNEKAFQSRIIFSESVLREHKVVSATRNKVNRFDQSTVQGALYTELACFGGVTELEIMVTCPDSETIHGYNQTSFEMLVAVLDAVLNDLRKGFLAVGGLVSIGRGIFEGNGPVTYNRTDADSFLKECRTTLCQELSSEGGAPVHADERSCSM